MLILDRFILEITGPNANPGYITITETSPTGNVVAHGFSPLTWLANSYSNHYIHWSQDSLCNSITGCHTSSIMFGSPVIAGCTDSTACNYNPFANLDDASCLVLYGCTSPSALNYDSLAQCDDGSCIGVVYGCIDPSASNYNLNANVDDGSCLFAGCTDSTASNFDVNANADCDTIVGGFNVIAVSII